MFRMFFYVQKINDIKSSQKSQTQCLKPCSDERQNGFRLFKTKKAKTKKVLGP